MKKLILTLLIACTGLLVNAQTADELFTSKEYVKASDAYSAVVKQEPENIPALRRLAFCYMNIENTEALAKQYFEKVLKLDPKDLYSNYYLGVIWKEALSKELTNDQRTNAKLKAKQYLQTAADLGSDDAKDELKALK